MRRVGLRTLLHLNSIIVDIERESSFIIFHRERVCNFKQNLNFLILFFEFGCGIFLVCLFVRSVRV